jgi:hypothetical protein
MERYFPIIRWVGNGVKLLIKQLAMQERPRETTSHAAFEAGPKLTSKIEPLSHIVNSERNTHVWMMKIWPQS